MSDLNCFKKPLVKYHQPIKVFTKAKNLDLGVATEIYTFDTVYISMQKGAYLIIV